MSRINSADELEVCEEVGRGAFGIVYRGLVKETNEEVAIKQIDLENEQADLIEVNKEIQIISECRISQITKFKGCFVKQYKLWVIMEYVNGGLLFELLKPGPVTNEMIILSIVKEILVALLYLHNQGKIHRDLKSQNILLNREGEIKLTDFGVSTQLSSNFSRRNTTVGTPYWMAPEVILNNNGGHSFKADIWSLGCCSFELLTGKPPLQDQFSPMKALREISKCTNNQDFIDLIGFKNLEVSDCFKDFLVKCFLVDPKERLTAGKLLKHKFITQHEDSANRVKELKKLITRKQLWDQDHHVSKIQNFYVPTEIKQNQEKWNQKQSLPRKEQQQQVKTIHFDISLIYEGDDIPTDGGGLDYRDLTPPGTGDTTPRGTPPIQKPKSNNNSTSPALQYHSLTRSNTRQDSLKKTIKPELTRITNKVFNKLETKYNLLTEQYDSLVSLNNDIISLLSFIQDASLAEKSPKVLICQYFRYFFKELVKDVGTNEARNILQKLIVPLILETKLSTPVTSTLSKRQKPTQFDEIEQSLLESWIDKMKEAENS